MLLLKVSPLILEIINHYCYFNDDFPFSSFLLDEWGSSYKEELSYSHRLFIQLPTYMSMDSWTFILFFGLESNTAIIYFVVQLLQLRPLAALQDDSCVPLTALFPPRPLLLKHFLTF